MFGYNGNGWPQPMPFYQQPILTPYHDQTFLATTFNSNPASIEAFHSLPHEDKLKLYLSV
jgi:hypothetical protein